MNHLNQIDKRYQSFRFLASTLVSTPKNWRIQLHFLPLRKKKLGILADAWESIPQRKMTRLVIKKKKSFTERIYFISIFPVFGYYRSIRMKSGTNSAYLELHGRSRVSYKLSTLN